MVIRNVWNGLKGIYKQKFVIGETYAEGKMGK